MKTETETQIRVLADIRFTKSAEEPKGFFRTFGEELGAEESGLVSLF